MVHAVSMFGEETLQKTFSAVAKALKPGGVFGFDTWTGQERGKFLPQYINGLPVYFLNGAINTHGKKFLPDMKRILAAAGFTSFEFFADGKPVDESPATFEWFDGYLDRQVLL